VLVGKTMEQALIEVMEEEELSNLREQQRRFQQLRNAELVEQQRLEEQDRRRRVEKVWILISGSGTNNTTSCLVGNGSGNAFWFFPV